MRSHHRDLCRVLNFSTTTLSSLTLELFAKNIIELDVKMEVLQKGGIAGADVLLTHVLMKTEHNPEHLDIVQKALENEHTLVEIIEKMKKDCMTTGEHCSLEI